VTISLILIGSNFVYKGGFRTGTSLTVEKSPLLNTMSAWMFSTRFKFLRPIVASDEMLYPCENTPLPI
jgi:hypothetical protein